MALKVRKVQPIGDLLSVAAAQAPLRVSTPQAQPRINVGVNATPNLRTDWGTNIPISPNLRTAPQAPARAPYVSPSAGVNPLSKMATTALASTGRFSVGIGQAFSGLYDWLSPGVGTNRFSDALDTKARELDVIARDHGYEVPYKIGNATLEMLLAIATGGASRAAKSAPGVSKVLTKADDVITKVGSKGGRVGKALAKYNQSDDLITDAALTLKNLGERSGKGEQITAQSLLLEAALGVGANTATGRLIKYLRPEAPNNFKPRKIDVKHPGGRPAKVDVRTPTKIDVKHPGGRPAKVNVKTAVDSFTSSDHDKRLSDAVAETTKRYEADLEKAKNLPADKPDPKNPSLEPTFKNREKAIKKVERQYEKEFSSLLEQRDNLKLPKRIEVKTGNPPKAKVVGPGTRMQIKVKGAGRPKVTAKASAEPNPYSKTGRPLTKDKKTLDLKISRVKDPVRKAELIAEREARFGTGKPKVTTKKEAPTPKQVYEVTKKGPNAVKRLITSVKSVISGYGEGGKAIARGLDAARNDYEKMAGKLANRFKNNVSDRLTDDEFELMWDAIEATGKGQKPKVPKHVAEAARETARIMKEIHNAAKAAGMDVGDQGSSYLPHIFDSDRKNMVNFIERKFNKKYGNLEKTREGMEGYEKTKDAILQYIDRSSERIAKAKQFGQSDEKLKQMFEMSAAEGYDVTRLGRYTDIALGNHKYNSTAEGVSSAIRQINAVTSLQRSAMANIGQSVNTTTITGLKNSGKALIKLLTDRNARDWARSTGVTLDHVLGGTQEQFAGVGGGRSKSRAINFIKKHVLVPGMQATERFNREHAVVAGAMFVDDLVKKASKGNKKATRLLGRFLPEYKPGMKVTDDMLQNGGRKVVELTQFKIDPQDLPGWTSGPVGKLIAQFRTFGYKQTQFMAREVIGEALHGNFGPMARFVAVGVPVGYSIGVARDKIAGRDTDTEQPLWQKAVTGFTQVGGGGMVQSETEQIANTIKYDTGEGLILNLAANAGGPTTSNLARISGAFDDWTDGNHKTAAVYAASKIPVVGPYVSNRVKAHFDKKMDKPVTEMTPKELDKYASKTYAVFKDGLSKEDQKLFETATDNTAKSLAIKSGKYTQDQIDDMETRWNRARFEAGLPINYINGIKDDDFNKMPPELQGMVLEASLVGKKKFTNSKELDPTAKAVMETAMKNAWPNVGDIKGSNKLAMDYLSAQQDIAKAGSDQGKQLDIVKAYWNKAVKQQYNDTVQNIYSNSIADIKRLAKGFTVAGKTYRVSKADIDKAVELDNRLLLAGLRDTPKFSNKVRKEAGYGAAPKSKVSGIGYAGPKGSSGGKGRAGSANTWRYAIGRSSGGRLSGSVPSQAKSSVKFSSVGGGSSVPKPKVTIKKSKV